MFKKLLSLLIVHSYNIHIYHWNISGSKFQPDHEFLGLLYDEVYKHIDNMTEIALQYSERPVSLQDALNILKDDTADHILVATGINYTSTEVFSSIIKIFQEILAEMNAVLQSENIYRAHKADIETLQSWYLLRAQYLLPQRLIEK